MPGIFVLAFLFVGLSVPALAQQYTVVDLGTLGGANTGVSTGAINEGGAIAGASMNAEGVYRAFLYTTSLADLGSLGGPSSQGLGLNDLQQVVGMSDTRNPLRPQYHAFSYKGGRFARMSDLGTLGGTVSSASGINNRGDICGTSMLAGNVVTHAFLLPHGTRTLLDLGTLGGTYSAAWAINDSGTVVGLSTTSSSTHGFVYKNGTLTDIGGLLGSVNASALHGINGAGVAVGYAIDADGRKHAITFDGTLHDLTPSLTQDTVGYAISPSGVVVGLVVVNPSTAETRAVVFQNGQAIDLNTLIPAGTGLTLLNAFAINSRGQIVGNARFGSSYHAYRLDPIPAAFGR